MSAAIPVAVPAGRRGRAVALLRATGPAGIASAVVIAIATFVALFGAFLAPYDPNLPNLSLAWVGPAGGHLLGFDFQGRDVLSRLLAGAATSMLGPLAVVVGSMIAGTVLAVTSAWRRGAAAPSGACSASRAGPGSRPPGAPSCGRSRRSPRRSR